MTKAEDTPGSIMHLVEPTKRFEEDSRLEFRDGMIVDWNVPILMDDGICLRADVFRPPMAGRSPVILSHGPYGKGLSFQEGYPGAWEIMVRNHPDVEFGSSNRYQSWEVVDPEKWVRDGYAVVRVDSRGSGCSPGFIDPFSPRETKDFYDCIEWAAVQRWSTGKIGLNGISYYGINQWQVASLRPPHLAAMCIWEGAADWYRDMTHHGGIVSTFWANWYEIQVKSVQYGLGERGRRNPVSGDLVCGTKELTEEQLAANRCDFGATILAHPLDDAYHKLRSADWSKIDVPFLSAANWGGQGLHARGNFEGFVRAASKQKWLEVHGLEHWTHFYTDYGRSLQKKFFDRFLKDEHEAWPDSPRVRLQVRHLDHFQERLENEWPLQRTTWTKLYLDMEGGELLDQPSMSASQLAFDAQESGVTFFTRKLDHPIEITGPIAVKLFVSSSSGDLDLFVVLRVFDEDGNEVVFQGAIDPHTPVAQGWLRCSHRKLDPLLSAPYRPYHAHDKLQPLTPGEVVEVDVELWPTSIVVPRLHRIALSIRGKDYEYPGPGARLPHFRDELKGCGPFLHNDPRDRPEPLFFGTTRLHSDERRSPYVLLPVIPKETSKAAGNGR